MTTLSLFSGLLILACVVSGLTNRQLLDNVRDFLMMHSRLASNSRMINVDGTVPKSQTTTVSVLPTTIGTKPAIANVNASAFSMLNSVLNSSGSNGNRGLPALPQLPGLPQHCSLDKRIRGLLCTIPSGATLKYDALRNWVRKTGMDHTVFIRCLPGGVVSLSWPMKASHISSLDVRDCIIHDFFNQMGGISAIPDKLNNLVMMNSIIRFNTDKIFRLVQRFERTGLPPKSACGQQTLKRYVFKNTKFETLSKRMSYIQYSRLGRFVQAFIRMTKLQTCNYPLLGYLDESGTKTTSMYRFNLLTSKPLFPSLKTYLSANVELQQTPSELVNYPTHFPCLSYMDLSSNFIRNVNFSFEMQTECLNRVPGPVYINMKGNQITYVPPHVLEFFLDNRVILDVRNNPIDCASQGMSLKSYAMDMSLVFPRYALVLKGSPCYNTKEVAVPRSTPPMPYGMGMPMLMPLPHMYEPPMLSAMPPLPIPATPSVPLPTGPDFAMPPLPMPSITPRTKPPMPDLTMQPELPMPHIFELPMSPISALRIPPSSPMGLPFMSFMPFPVPRFSSPYY